MLICWFLIEEKNAVAKEKTPLGAGSKLESRSGEEGGGGGGGDARRKN